MKSRRFLYLAAAIVTALLCAFHDGADARSPQNEYRDAVVQDWARQEREHGREIASLEALSALVERATNAVEYIDGEDWIDDDAFDVFQKELERVREFVNSGPEAYEGDEPIIKECLA